MKNYNHLTQEKRYMLSQLLQVPEKYSLRKIAKIIEVSHSTVVRELQRNKGSTLRYQYQYAQQRYMKRRAASKKRQEITPELQIKIIEKLNQDWSPEQISGRFRLEGISQVSHQTIYNWLWSDRKNGGILYKKLRRKRKYRAHKTKATHLCDRRPIEERPASVDARNRFGDWEIDTVIPNKGDPCVMLTAVERKSRYLLAALIEDRKSSSIRKKLIRLLHSAHTKPLTITSDNGTEFAEHKTVAHALKCDFFFANPYHPWERGSNENTNGLIRQYMPSGKPFNMNKRLLSHAIERINNRPRKCLGFRTAKEVFQKENAEASRPCSSGALKGGRDALNSEFFTKKQSGALEFLI